MKMKKTLMGFLAACMFLLIVEGGAAALLKLNFGKSPVFYQQEIADATWPQISSHESLRRISSEKGSRRSTLAKRLIAADIQKYSGVSPRKVDPGLRDEPKVITGKGVRTGKSLFGGNYLYNPDVDDVFENKGRYSGKRVYAHRITVDQFGRRVSKAGPKPAFNFIFLGCSFTFGEGINTEETFPSQLVDIFPKARAFNLGMHGLSPSHILRNISVNRERIFKGTEDLPTIVIYTWIDDHLYRAISTMRYLQRSPDIDPTWDPGIYLENGKLRLEKSFFEGMTPHQFYLRFGKLNSVRLSGLDLPIIGDLHFELLAEVITEIKKVSKEIIPEMDGFVVASYPYANPIFKKLIPQLKKRQITVFDYSDISLEGLMNGYHDLGADGHPSAEANRIYARLLAEDLVVEFPRVLEWK